MRWTDGAMTQKNAFSPTKNLPGLLQDKLSINLSNHTLENSIKDTYNTCLHNQNNYDYEKSFNSYYEHSDSEREFEWPSHMFHTHHSPEDWSRFEIPFTNRWKYSVILAFVLYCEVE